MYQECITSYQKNIYLLQPKTFLLPTFTCEHYQIFRSLPPYRQQLPQSKFLPPFTAELYTLWGGLNFSWVDKIQGEYFFIKFEKIKQQYFVIMVFLTVLSRANSK